MTFIDNICYVKLGIETNTAFRLHNYFYSLLAVADKLIRNSWVVIRDYFIYLMWWIMLRLAVLRATNSTVKAK